MRLGWIALALALSGCGDLLKDQKQPDNPDAFKDVTDQSRCQGTPPSTATIVGTWMSRQIDGHGNTIVTTMTVGDGTTGTVYSQTCTYPGKPLYVGPMIVSSTVDKVNLQYQITSNNQLQSNGIDTNGIARTCSLNVQQVSFAYGYKGACVVVRDLNSGGVGVLVPAQ